ncbi:MAG: Trm112 family protein [Desulfobulbaceae bacterium]|jgi:uncharacterized protein YbaR (Trm112 family)|nr:Trm112 family protein [Desulfobulbaceae bacterium]
MAASFRCPGGQYDTNDHGGTSMIKQELLDILACPKCKHPVRLTGDGNGLICDHCRLLYPIRDDIPIMLIDEARQLDDWEPGME